MNIRTITVELLRAGPRHNQLMSPLTQYLGVCGNAPAGIVTLPYEHRDLEQRLQELCYQVEVVEDSGANDSKLERRRATLEKTGQEIAEVLSRIPGVSGALISQTEQLQTITQLRIVLSASELAMLPFELTKAPAGAGSSGVWLGLQTRTPVCITRHIRSVSAEGVEWPSQPRILFIAGPDTPFQKHHAVLKEAVEPWCDLQDKESLNEHLVVLEKATLERVALEVATAAQKSQPFTHVHVLAHGARHDDKDRYSAVGLQLHDEVVTGGRLASMLTAVSECRVVRPAVVTLATCDSAKMTNVLSPSGSVAHDLHDQGIPLVVASQFPLSVMGSTPFVKRFYHGQLWGEHPLVSLYAVRLQLYGILGPDAHDWASLVAYEAFPSDLSAQLEELRYWQTRLAQDRALKRLETLVLLGDGVPLGSGDDVPPPRPQPSSASTLQARYNELVEHVNSIAARLPRSGPYGLECDGLRASGLKRLAKAVFDFAKIQEQETQRRALVSECMCLLKEARSDYRRATDSFLGPSSEPRRKKANLHWLLGQVLTLDVVLGRPFETEFWAAAHLSARIDADNPDMVVRAWGYVNLSELALVRLADKTIGETERSVFVDKALNHADTAVNLVGWNSEHAMTTSRQFERYFTWWNDNDFKDGLARLNVTERPHWEFIAETAKLLVDRLRGTDHPSPRLKGDKGSGGATPEPRSIGDDRNGCASPAPPTSAVGRPQATAVATKPVSVLSRRAETARGSAKVFDIEMLPAENGDCLWIEYGDREKPRRMLVDCGAVSTARKVASRVAKFSEASEHSFELFVLTHIDADHISGVLPLFENPELNIRFKDVWFNGWRQLNQLPGARKGQFLDIRQGEQFSRLLEKHKLPWNSAITPEGAEHPAPMVINAGKPLPCFELPDGMRLTLLSPGEEQLEKLRKDWGKVLRELQPKTEMLTRKAPPLPVENFDRFDLEAVANTPANKDTSVANGSSIALLAEYDGRSVLLTGDAHADVLASSIAQLQRERKRDGLKLKLDALKLSHHGSANATTLELLELIDCSDYLVSTNGKLFYHPDREAIARVVLQGGERPTLCFNYRSELNALWDNDFLRKKYKYAEMYPVDVEQGLRISL